MKFLSLITPLFFCWSGTAVVKIGLWLMDEEAQKGWYFGVWRLAREKWGPTWVEDFQTWVQKSVNEMNG